jgi:hypothetical protein
MDQSARQRKSVKLGLETRASGQNTYPSKDYDGPGLMRGLPRDQRYSTDEFTRSIYTPKWRSSELEDLSDYERELLIQQRDADSVNNQGAYSRESRGNVAYNANARDNFPQPRNLDNFIIRMLKDCLGIKGGNKKKMRGGQSKKDDFIAVLRNFLDKPENAELKQTILEGNCSLEEEKIQELLNKLRELGYEDMDVRLTEVYPNPTIGGTRKRRKTKKSKKSKKPKRQTKRRTKRN